MNRTMRQSVNTRVTTQLEPYPRGPLGPNPANDMVVSAALDEPTPHEREVQRIAEVKRVAGST